MRADRLGRLRAAAVARLDDVVRICADRAARRLRSLGELVGDRIALGADRVDGLRPACADAADDLVRVSVDGAAHRGRRRRQVVPRPTSPCAVTVSAASDRRAATMSPWTAERLRGFGAAVGNAAHDVVRMRDDGVARGSGGLGEANGDGVAMGSNGFENLCAAGANAADDYRRYGRRRRPTAPAKPRQVDPRSASPCPLIASTARALLPLMRPTTSSA